MAGTIETISGLERVRERFSEKQPGHDAALLFPRSVLVFPETPERQAELIRTAYHSKGTHPILRGHHATPEQIYAVARAIFDRASNLMRYTSLDRFVKAAEGEDIKGGVAEVVGDDAEPNYEGLVFRLAAGRVSQLIYWDSPLIETHIKIGFPREWRVNRYLEEIEQKHGIRIARP